MPRVPVHDTESAPDGTRETLEELEQQYGMVLNIFGEMANAPALLEMFVGAERTLAEKSSLGEPTREAIHLAVAAVNECDYCQSAYTGAAKQAGFSEDETVAIREGRLEDDELSPLLDLARELVANKGHVEDATWKQATDAGWSEQQLLEAYADAVRGTMTNWFNHLVHTEIDVPTAPGIEA
jgi:AhpD family alkylhydroperoxidase